MIRNLTIILCLLCLLSVTSCHSPVTDPLDSTVESFGNAQVVLPSDGEIAIRWVIPPLDHDAIEKSRRNRRHLKFVVGPEGTPWIGYNKTYLMNPVKQVWVEVLKGYQDLTQLDNGVIIISKSTEFGFMAAQRREDLTSHQQKAKRTPRVALQPIAQLPIPNCRMFRGADNCLYFSGLNKSTSLYEVYLLEPENVMADGQKTKTLTGYKHIFSSPKTINAVSGDGNTTYIAVENAILSVRPVVNAAETIFVHPNQSITQLQYNTESGLFYSTNDKIGYVGKNGHLEFFSRPGTQMSLNSTSLYVFSEHDFGILAFDHIDDLSRMNLHIKKMVPTEKRETEDQKPEVFAQLGHMSDGWETGVGAVAFSHDGRYVISGAGPMSDGLVKLWDSTGKEIRTFTGLKGGVHFVTMSPDNRYAMAFDGYNLKAWDIFDGKEILTIPISENRPVWAAFSPKGKTLSVFGSKTLDIWEISSGSKIRTITNLRDIDNIVSNNNKYVFAHDSSNSDDVIIYDAITGDPAKRVKSFAGELPAFSDNCVYAANGMSHFGEISLSNFKNGERAAIKITGRPMKLFISRDGEFVGAIVDDSKISDELPHKYSFRVWKFSDGEMISNIILPDNIDLPFYTSPVAPSPDWKQVVVGVKDGSVKFLDIATGKELFSIVAEQDNQDRMARGFDRYIATIPNDTWIFWDVHEGASVEQSEFTKEEILPYFSKNSFNEARTIMMSSNATSSDQNHHAKNFNGTVKLFDSKTDQEIAQFIHYTDGEWIVITPEGYYNASPNGEKHLNVRIGLNVFGIENYSETFFRPDLVKAALANVGAGKDEDGLVTLMEAVQDGDTETVNALLAKGADANTKNNDNETVLMLAAVRGHTEIVEVLLAKGADIKATNEYGGTALREAAGQGHTETVEVLLAKGANIKATNKQGGTALMLAARRGHTEAVVALLAKGADINAKNKQDGTALSEAAVYGRTETVVALLAKGADVTAKDKDGGTALMLAAGHGRTEIVVALLAKGADANAKYNGETSYLDGKTALILAEEEGHIEVMKALLAKGADANTKNKNGETILMLAAENGRTETVVALLAKGADANAKYNGETSYLEGKTAFMLAAENGHTETVEVLLAKGADINAKNKYGKTLLMLAAENGHTKTVEALLTKSADINARKTGSGGTALMAAAENGHTETVEVLLAKGADIKAQNTYGGTSLMLAAKNGHTETVEVLLAKGADINAKTGNGGTALMGAAENGHTQTVEVLLAKGADSNAKNMMDGTTILMLAAGRGHTETVKVLLANGADCNAKNSFNQTALTLAAEEGYIVIIRLLKQAGARK